MLSEAGQHPYFVGNFGMCKMEYGEIKLCEMLFFGFPLFTFLLIKGKGKVGGNVDLAYQFGL